MPIAQPEMADLIDELPSTAQGGWIKNASSFGDCTDAIVQWGYPKTWRRLAEVLLFATVNRQATTVVMTGFDDHV